MNHTAEKITLNFTWAEFTHSDTAARLGIDNTPDEAQCEAIIHHHETFRQPLREYLGAVLTTTSGFRCAELAGWINLDKATGQPVHYRSHHEARDGYAASDNECFSLGSNALLAHQIINERSLSFDQLILEYHNPNVRNSGWVHVSTRMPDYGHMRRQILTKNYGEGYKIISPAALAELAKQ